MKKTLIALASLIALSVFAQEALVVATGDLTPDPSAGGRPKSTYAAMYRDLIRACSNVVPLQERTSTGSPMNLQLLADKEVDGAIVQGDLLTFIDQTDPAKVANVKTVFALAPEELHFIARADVKKEGGIMGYGATKVEFKTLADLQGRKVGGVGGSILSGRVVAKQSGLNFQMVDAGNNENLQKMLLEGQFDAILVVGGAPHGLVKTLDARFRLLPISSETAEKLKAYTKATLSYANLNQAGVPTVQTQALLVSRVFRDPEMLNKLSKFRACFKSSVYKLQDAKGTHPKWGQVDPANEGKWAYYELPAAK
jgi:TRAP-type uncharacterized transport system substrate-binding protein